jgi:hypothetical protein
MIPRVDKDNVTLILRTEDYHMKMQTLLNDTIYRKLATDLTVSIERQAVALIKKSAITQEWLDKILPHASVPPRLYGLPKIHKDDVALIPIVNYIS